MTETSPLEKPRPSKTAGAKWDSSFPVETLEKIFGYLEDERNNCATRIIFTREKFQPVLRSAAIVCHAWYEVATKYLYSEIYISSSRNMELLADALVKHKHLRPLVHQFYLTSRMYMTGNPPTLHTAMDLYNYRRIHDSCPNLLAIVRGAPWRRYPLNDDNLAFRALKFDRANIDRLTYMYISMPAAALFGGRMMFSSSLEFPALQQLYIICSWRSYPINSDSDLSSPQWFRTPQLRRLCLQDFRPRAYHTLTFPNSPFLNTIDIMRCDFEMINNLFDPETSPLLPLRKTLQTLTIDGKQLGKPHYSFGLRMSWSELISPHRQSSTAWSMGFLENLVELCLPFRSFSRIGITSYPPRLRDLILVGNYWDHYKEPLDEIACGQSNMSKLFTAKRNGRALRDLKRVRVLVKNIDGWSFNDGLCAQSLGVEMDMGLEMYKLKDLGSDFIDIGLKKVHLR